MRAIALSTGAVAGVENARIGHRVRVTADLPADCGEKLSHFPHMAFKLQLSSRIYYTPSQARFLSPKAMPERYPEKQYARRCPGLERAPLQATVLPADDLLYTLHHLTPTFAVYTILAAPNGTSVALMSLSQCSPSVA
ncbi:hypothetical protein MSAN_00178100 [Mycena sanguinolenta]|uniref:Uncharacterized protein n=1 Tax=Mycena sanguinolenta TaxID=230812 RepID=A0A8H6ZEL0_9AGAR|nr:hypothetical protein MSAN_00178100 [Mycena sanguinolenta]